MKIYLITISLFLFAPLAVFAATNDVTISGSTIIHVAEINLTVNGSPSFDSITVDSGSFSLSLSGGKQLVVTSSDRRDFTVSPAGYRESLSCGSSESVLVVKNDLQVEAATVTVTPLTTLCSSAGGGVRRRRRRRRRLQQRSGCSFTSRDCAESCRCNSRCSFFCGSRSITGIYQIIESRSSVKRCQTSPADFKLRSRH